MNEIEFVYPLSSDQEDRLRIRAAKFRGRIVSFVVIRGLDSGSMEGNCPL